MINSAKLSAGLRGSFIREVLLPLAAILLLTLAGAGTGLFLSTSISNQKAQAQQQRMIEASFAQSLAEHQRQLHSLSRWTPLLTHLEAAQPDPRWLDDNVGRWLYEMFGHQLIMVLDEARRPVQAWRNGALLTDPARDAGVQAILASALLRAAAQQEAADLARVDGRVAALAIGAIRRDAQAAPRFMLVSLKYLDDGYLAALAERSQLKGLRFSDPGAPPVAPARFMLTSQTDGDVGYINWDPARPGAEMLRAIGPSTGVAVLVVTLLCLYMVRRLWTSSFNLSQSMLKLGASEAQALHLAFHDVLTGLPNRALVEDRLTQALALATRHEQRVALMLIDLDRFKNINDTYGHHAGDELIIAVAHRLAGLMRACDTVGRIGGDEFLVVMPEVDHIGQVEALAQRILDALSQPFPLFGGEVWSGASIGLVLAPKDGVDRQELVRKADIALYEAKSSGRGKYRQFERVMDESIRTRQSIAADLRAALQNFKGLAVWY